MSARLFSEIHLAHGKAELHQVTTEAALRRDSDEPGRAVLQAWRSMKGPEVGDLGLDSDSITYLLMTLRKKVLNAPSV